MKNILTPDQAKKFLEENCVLNKLSEEFKNSFIDDSFVFEIVCRLQLGTNPYKIIEELLIAHKELADDYTRLLMEKDVI